MSRSVTAEHQRLADSEARRADWKIGASHQTGWTALVANLLQRGEDAGCPYCTMSVQENADER